MPPVAHKAEIQSSLRFTCIIMIWKCKLGPLVCFTPIIKPRFLSFFEKKQTHEFGFQEPVNFLADSNLQKNDIRAGYV
jgi:hypothetical protein